MGRARVSLGIGGSPLFPRTACNPSHLQSQPRPDPALCKPFPQPAEEVGTKCPPCPLCGVSLQPSLPPTTAADSKRTCSHSPGLTLPCAKLSPKGRGSDQAGCMSSVDTLPHFAQRSSCTSCSRSGMGGVDGVRGVEGVKGADGVDSVGSALSASPWPGQLSSSCLASASSWSTPHRDCVGGTQRGRCGASRCEKMCL